MSHSSQGAALPTFEGHLAQTQGSTARRTNEGSGHGVRFDVDPFLSPQVNGNWSPGDLRDFREVMGKALSEYQQMGYKIKDASSKFESLVEKATRAKIEITNLNCLVRNQGNKLFIEIRGMVWFRTADSKGEAEDLKTLEKWLIGGMGEHVARHEFEPSTAGSTKDGAMYSLFTTCQSVILVR